MRDKKAENALVAHLSEELGLPLTGLLDDLQFLRDRVAAFEDPELTEKLEEVLSIGELLRTVATPLAALAQLEQRGRDLRKDRLALTEILKELESIEGDGPELSLEIRGELGQLRSDRQLLGRVLKSLVAAAGPETRLHLRAHREVHRPYHRVVLEFRFEGVGTLAPAERRHLAARALASMLARRLAQAMDGEFRMGTANANAKAKTKAKANANADGDSWTLELPVETGEEAIPARPVLAFDSRRSSRSVSGGSRRGAGSKSGEGTAASPSVLIVDDEPVIVQYMTRILEHEGFDVLTASDAEEALLLAKTSLPDVVTVSSFVGRDADVTFARTLENDPALAGTPVVVIGAEDAGDLEPSSELDGFAAYLTKPIDPQDLLSAIQPLVGPRISPVLLVDGDGDRRQRRKDLLLRAGFRVIEAENEKKARALLEEAVPSLAVVCTGRRRGLSALAKRLSAGKGPAVPILVLLPASVASTTRRWLEAKATRLLKSDEATDEAVLARVKELTRQVESIPDVVG